ncbi:MAG TPA: radical SAM protein [bacterium]|nr:radical SAM protein [bacterium]
MKEGNDYPSYLKAYRDGSLSAACSRLVARLKPCDLCPRRCGVNRLDGGAGFCGSGRLASVFTYQRHMGEEPVISGERGSGTVFFSHCNMKCIYCQNYRFSSLGEGVECEPERLAAIFMEIQEMGCHNLNLVTPSHVVPQILEALILAIPQGFSLPIVYNTSGYESADVISELAGIVDIYLPDMRYGDDGAAMRCSNAPGYVAANRAAVAEMFRQAGPLAVEGGVARRGMIVRHLVLPGGLSGTATVFRFIAERLSKDIHISLMRQYNPVYKAAGLPPLDRRITDDEYADAVKLLEEYGLENGWIQDEHGDKEVETFLGENFSSMA